MNGFGWGDIVTPVPDGPGVARLAFVFGPDSEESRGRACEVRRIRGGVAAAVSGIDAFGGVRRLVSEIEGDLGGVQVAGDVDFDGDECSALAVLALRRGVI